MGRFASIEGFGRVTIENCSIEGTGGIYLLDHDGRATTTYKAGETFYVEAGKVHEGINKGSAPVRAIASFVVEKGKPLTTQAK